MAVYLSPGVFVNEIDLSVLPTGVGPLRPAFIGTAQKGPMNTPTFVSNSQDFIDKFGEPITDSSLGYGVLAYMEEGNNAFILRVGVECEEGQVDDLADICIDTSGNREDGWARIPIFSGIDFGTITLRDVTSDDPAEFHVASVYDEEYVDIDVSATDGPTTATIGLIGTYTGSIDDSFIVLITAGPSVSSGSTVADAEYQVIRNSDGAVISSGVLAESGTPGETVPFSIGSGDDDTGLDAVITVTGTSPIEENDSFLFKVEPDNLTFSIEVEGSSTSASFTDGDTYTTNAAFADAFNLLAGPDMIAVGDDDRLIIRTSTAGERIQVTGTEAWALEMGISNWTYDIPRSNLISTDEGPYLISTSNNRVNMLVIGSEETEEIEVSIASGVDVTPDSVAASLDAGGIVAGERFYESFALQVTDDDKQVVIATSVDHQLDTLKMQADFSHIRTLRFAEELGILFPYTENFRTFSDPRLVLPDSGVVTESSPLSCETDPASDECAQDSAYFANIVGWFVAKSPGTWLNGYTVKLEIYNETGGRFQVRLFDTQGVEVDRVDDVSFDPRETRYIANVVNEGSPIGGINGNSFYQWDPRPAFLGNDPDDTSSFEVRNPGGFTSKAFSGGQNGIPPSAEYSSELDRAIIGNVADSTGLFALENPETFDFNLLSIPGNSSGAVIGQALQFAESRGDVLFLVDPPFGLRPQQAVDWHNGMLLSDLTSAINSNYGALYWSWVKIFDQFNGGEIFIPPSGHVASVFSRTARVSEQWFAPAGLRRGRLLTALDLEYNPNMSERDLLYGSGNAVNPIVKFAQEGITVFGQRTLQRTASALDRVNVRMLLIFLKKNLTPLLRNFLFEPIDNILFAQVRNAIEPFMEDILARRGISAFRVVCDETNNTPARIDANELHVAIFIKPIRAAEFIVLNLVVLRTEQSFTSEEVLAAGGVVTA